MRNLYFKIIALILAMLGICMGANYIYNSKHAVKIKNTYMDELSKAPAEENPLRAIGDDENYLVSDEFTTHLPLVILDLPEGEPPIAMEKVAGGDFASIEGVEPNVEGRFYLINNENGVNSVNDIPQIDTRVQMRRRGNTSSIYAKAQWMIKFYTESGQYDDIDVLGMGEEHEWILNGSLADKSMMRNYLAYSIASEFMPYVPDEQYCEVLIRENGQLRYQGVYLLGESIKQGPNRIDIEDYSTTQIINSYVVRRDRIDEDGVMLDTYGRLNGYNDRYIGLIYPSKYEVSQDVISYVEQDISGVEKVLYSKDDKVFFTYSDVIDVDSFVDYYLLNEFFTSYDAGLNSTYSYKKVGGKLAMGPVWDFDGTMDNYAKEPAETEDMAFQVKPWFDVLCTDKAFVQKLIIRYAELRNTSFSDEHITEKINSIVAHLGGAIDREWYRWGYWYEDYHPESYIGLDEYVDEEGTVLYRNATTFEDELYRMRTNIREHGEKIPAALIYAKSEAKRDSGLPRWKNWLLLITAVAFIVPSIYVAKGKR